HALRIRHVGVLAHLSQKKRFGHGRYVLVAEPNVRSREERVAWFHGRGAELAALGVCDDVVREDLLRERHRARRRLHRGGRDRAREARAVVRKEAAMLDDGGADGVESLREFGHRDLFTALDTADEREIRAREKTDVLRVLAVNLLDALRDDELHPSLQLAV